MTGTALDGWFLPPAAGELGRAEAKPERGVRSLEVDAGSARALLATLRAGRVALLSVTAAERAGVLGRAGARFLDPHDPLRQEAEARLPENAGVSGPMARAVIDGMARDWTAARLLDTITADFGDARALDEFIPGPQGRRVRAVAPALAVHVSSGAVPGVSATSLLRSLLVGSATLLSAGDVVLPVLLARAIAEEAPALAGALAVVYWPGGRGDGLEEAALAEADLVVAYGGDDAVRALRARVPVTTPLVAYHHRVSVAIVGADASIPEAAVDLALAVALFDQRGCVSPHVVFAEQRGESRAGDLARVLGAELARLDTALPPGPIDPAQASAVHQLRGAAEMRAAAGEPVTLHTGTRVSWTVVLERTDRLELPCLGRTIRVHSVADALEVPERLTPWRRHLQTVGVAGVGERLPVLAAELGAVGAVRICPLREMPFPPPWWHHDGRGPLTSLVRWVDLES